MTKRIVVKEWWGTHIGPFGWRKWYGMEEFITAQTINGFGNPFTQAEGRMLDGEIDRLRSLAVGEEMPLGEPEAGMIVQRLADAPSITVCHQWNETIMERLAQEQCWYPLAVCNRKANDSITEHGREIGYCTAHAEEIRQRYARSGPGQIGGIIMYVLECYMGHKIEWISKRVTDRWCPDCKAYRKFRFVK